MDRILTHTLLTPAGRLMLGEHRGKLCMASWADRPAHRRVCRRLASAWGADFVPTPEPGPLLSEVALWLADFFAGRQREPSIPLEVAGTPFQREVWARIAEIPLGHTVTYARLAQLVGRPRATRAVARAVGDNAISVLIPCHRVVASGGAPGGYAGGPEAKLLLLGLEKSLFLF